MLERKQTWKTRSPVSGKDWDQARAGKGVSRKNWTGGAGGGLGSAQRRTRRRIEVRRGRWSNGGGSRWRREGGCRGAAVGKAEEVYCRFSILCPPLLLC
jgi:hypothetical protein